MLREFPVSDLPGDAPVLLEGELAERYTHEYTGKILGFFTDNRRLAFEDNYLSVLDTDTGIYYDPSYGSAAQPDHHAWENNAIDGLARLTPLPNVGFIKGVLPAPPTELVLNAINFPYY